MNSAFDRDIITANTIYIIGYSFGDEHINQSIKTALRENSNLKIKIVCYNYQRDDLELKLANNIFHYSSAKLNNKNIIENVYSYHSGSIMVYDMEFKNFLKNHSND